MKQYIALVLALLFAALCFSACTPQNIEQPMTEELPGNPHETAFTGYIVQTDSAVFFVAKSDSAMLKKDDFVRLKTAGTDFDLSQYLTGDVVKITLVTIEESYPMQAKLHGIEFVETKPASDIPQTALDTLASLGYQIIIYA